MVGKERRFYKVVDGITRQVLNDHLAHGYEDRWAFCRSLRSIVDRWNGRVGECVGHRHGFYRLRFHDTPGGMPDEDWIPEYLTEPCDIPEYMRPTEPDGMDVELDSAFGFDF